MSIEARFWSKVEKSDDGCWLWTACIVHGYGQFVATKRQRVKAHRFAYELLVGPIPEGLVLDHLCRVKHCVNPAHLEPVPQSVNMVRGLLYDRPAHNALKTHCNNGHEYSPENTYVNAKGWRICVPCRRVRNARYKSRRRTRMAERGRING